MKASKAERVLSEAWNHATSREREGARLLLRTQNETELRLLINQAELALRILDAGGRFPDTQTAPAPEPRRPVWVAFELVDDGPAILGVEKTEEAAKHLADGGNTAWEWSDDERGAIAYREDDPVHTLHVQEATLAP